MGGRVGCLLWVYFSVRGQAIIMGINSNLLLKQCTIHEAHTKLLTFPIRYHHFQPAYQKNFWKFYIISDSIDFLIIQLTDQTFEPPRGTVSSDQPYIYVQMTQKGNDVGITFSLKWQKLKTVCLLFGLIFWLLYSTTLICMNTLGSKPFVFGILFILLGLITATVWLVRNIRHDLMIKRIFVELLQRNFSAVHI